MSTPRPPITEMEFRMCTCNQRDGDKTCPLHSGVAAPLEPTKLTPEEYLKEWGSFSMIGPGRPYSYWMGFAEAYAAAVSKNLQEELAKALAYQQQLIGLMAELNFVIKRKDSRILALEKEITALRETK